MRKFLLVFLLVFLSQPFADEISDSNQVFDWAESQYPQYFSPSGQQSADVEDYYARFYPSTDNYLGTKNGRVYVHGDTFGGLLDVGPISDYLSQIPIPTPTPTATPTPSSSMLMAQASAEQMAGWSSTGLAKAKAYWESYGSTAIAIIEDGYIIAEWGDTERPISCYSVRKSLLSALYGNPVNNGQINLNWTLEQIGIDDSVPPSLTSDEKQASIKHLLMARSGVYHPAAYETSTMKAERPERGSHDPGTYFYYNNWDFNTAGSIYEQLTGNGIFNAFEQQIANPIGMQHYSLDNMQYSYESDISDHPAYLFKLSTLDRARFGLLFLNNGQWDGEQIIPSKWITESTTLYSVVDSGVGFGYMWWVSDNGWLKGYQFEETPFSARGNNGQYILIIPERDLVVVQSMDTSTDDYANNRSFNDLFELIIEAQILPSDQKERITLH